MVGTIKRLKDEDAKFVDKRCNWTSARHWASWWMRLPHLQMLHKDFSLVSDEIWKKCPDNTNAVERKNRDSKQSVALPIHHAFINLYKLDRAYCATYKHLAARRGGSIHYYEKSSNAQAKAAEVRKKQRQTSRASDSEALFGPPDKDISFQPRGNRKR